MMDAVDVRALRVCDYGIAQQQRCSAKTQPHLFSQLHEKVCQLCTCPLLVILQQMVFMLLKG
jgi:hypothetical protein